MLTAFVDETGTHGGSVTGVATTLFREDGLRWFEEAWAEHSKELGGLPYHTVDAVWRKRDRERNPFRRWSDDARRDFLLVLAGMVRDASEATYIANIDRGSFAMWAAENPQEIGSLHSEYAICTLQVLGMVSHGLEVEPGAEVYYVIEQSEEHSAGAALFFNRIGKTPELKARFRIAGYEEAPKGSLPGLVAPDLVGWLWQRAVTEATAIEGGKPPLAAAPVSRIWGPANDILLGGEDGPPVFGVNMDERSLTGLALRTHLAGIGRD
ncbi:MAG: hypothetical protein JWM33_661 [Caulobacteraceae bacterium]|nr:hypothetical protein [Caulobacteraceae bacterium]